MNTITDNALGLEQTFATDLEGLYVPWKPHGFQAPSLLVLNRPLATELGLDPAWLERHGAALLSGSETLPGSQPLAPVALCCSSPQCGQLIGDRPRAGRGKWRLQAVQRAARSVCVLPQSGQGRSALGFC